MDSYSRAVSYLKVLLPLAALAILSTLFMISRGPEVDATIPFAATEIEDRLRSRQVTGPRFSSVTQNGGEVLVTATTVRPGNEESESLATDLRAELRMASGGLVTLGSSQGALSPTGETARFEGDAVVTSDVGWTVYSDRIEAELSGMSAASPGPVRAKASIGTLEAGSMRMETKTKGGPVHMLFNNRVKLVYVPANGGN